MFRRKKWKYLILDEAHMIKNWKSQRWQTLLRFNSKRRLLITGTPLQVRVRRWSACRLNSTSSIVCGPHSGCNHQKYVHVQCHRCTLPLQCKAWSPCCLATAV